MQTGLTECRTAISGCPSRTPGQRSRHCVGSERYERSREIGLGHICPCFPTWPGIIQKARLSYCSRNHTRRLHVWWYRRVLEWNDDIQPESNWPVRAWQLAKQQRDWEAEIILSPSPENLKVFKLEAIQVLENMMRRYLDRPKIIG